MFHPKHVWLNNMNFKNIIIIIIIIITIIIIFNNILQNTRTWILQILTDIRVYLLRALSFPVF